MSTCPEKDLHSIYLDGELPEEFLKEYENHVAGCEKCKAELEKLRKVSVPFREDALSVRLDQTYLEQSFERLQTKMRFKKTTERCEKSYIVRPYIKWASGFAAVAAVFAVIVTPLSLKSNSKEQKELTAIARTQIKPIQESRVVVDGNLDSLKISSALSSAKQVEEKIEAKEENSDSPVLNPNQKVVSATSLASNLNDSFDDIDVFRPDFNNSSVSVRIEVPRMYTIPMRKAEKIENR